MMTMQEATIHRGSIIKMHREMQKWTIGELAEAMGLTPPYISMIENGRRTPRDMSIWQRFAKVLSIPQSVLMGDDGNGKSPGQHSVDIADEESILVACWSLFYRSGSIAAVPVVYSAIRRIGAAAQNSGVPLRLLGRYHQLAGVMARDSGDFRTAITHGTVAADIARQQEEPEALAAALFRLARSYHAQKNEVLALQMSREAMALAPRCRAPLRGYLYQQMADIASELHADPQYLVERTIENARTTAKGSLDDDASFTILSEAGIAHDEAQIRLRYGAKLADVRIVIDRAMKTLPVDAVRWRTSLACTEVLAYATHGEVDSAVILAEDVLIAAKSSDSQYKRLIKSYHILEAKAPNAPAVKRLGSRLTI